MTEGSPDRFKPAPPSNVEAEQALLGALFANNRLIDDIADWLKPAHFYQETHGDIYAVCLDIIQSGKTANPVTLKPHFETHPGLTDIGAAKYLARLYGAAVNVNKASDYAAQILDCYQRRQAIFLAEDMEAAARSFDTPIEQMLEHASGAMMNIYTASTQTEIIPIGQAADAVLDAVDEARERGDGLLGISTGFKKLDDTIGGLVPTNLVILAGRPGMGKSSAGLQLALNAAEGGHGVGFISLEMSAPELTVRALTSLAWRKDDVIAYRDVLAGKVRNDTLFKQESRIWHARQKLQSMPIEITDRAGIGLAGIRSAARQIDRNLHRQDKRLELLIVDHLTIVGEQPERGENKVALVGRISNGLKQLAKDLNLPVVALCQLSRGLESREDKRPNLADLRWSGEIEQDADVVAFVFRKGYYLDRIDDAELTEEQHKEKTKWRDRADMLIEKNRQGKSPESVQLMCYIEASRLHERSEDHDDKEANFDLGSME